MQCWICKRHARGYGHFDTRRGRSPAARYPTDWVFCSRRCQDAFHKLYGNWMRLLQGASDVAGAVMIDASEVERAAMRACLKYFGSVAERIGFDKPLGAYTEHEALQVIDAIVTGYTQAMVSHHEVTAFPPMVGAPRTPDPLRAVSGEFQDDPLPDRFVKEA